MTNKVRIIFLAAFLILSTTGYAQQVDTPLEKKIAQMIVLGFRGSEVSDTCEIVHAIQDKGIGGVIIFGRNIASTDSHESLRRLCEKLQSVACDKLIISIDQEGGRVDRLKTKYGFEKSVTAQYLGEINREDTSRHYYHRMAHQLQALGINVNFAPCVDLNINAECPAIGIYGRSYSASVRKVNRHARFLVEEHHRSGIKTSLKHFPGHGSSVADSHLGFTDITNTWSGKELRPYRYFIRKSLCDMVMVSHTFNSKLDPDYPATLSRRTIDSLLRKKMGYNGVVITDDMNMKAIAANYTFEQAMALTINAGVDLIIISNNLSREDDRTIEQIVGTIVSLVDQGVISRSRIDESYDRIMRLKQSSITQ